MATLRADPILSHGAQVREDAWSSLRCSVHPRIFQTAEILIGITSLGAESERVQADWPDGTLAEHVLVPASTVALADGIERIDATQLSAVSRFVIPYGGLVRGRLAAGETLVVNGATGAYGGAAVLLALAMGAGRVVAAGRNAEKLNRLARVAGEAVAPVAHGRQGQGCGSVVGGVRRRRRDRVRHGRRGQGSSFTLATLNCLRRGGRLVLMRSITVDLPISYMQPMINSLEIIGNFMHPVDAYRRLLAMVRGGRLDLTAIAPAAMEAAQNAGSRECVVIRP